MVGPDVTCEATVVAVQGFEVMLTTARELGERIPTATLVTAPYYLLEILAERLTEARDGRLPANRHLAVALFAREEVATLTGRRTLGAPPASAAAPARPPATDPEVRPDGSSLNPEQRAAIETALIGSSGRRGRTSAAAGCWRPWRCWARRGRARCASAPLA